METWCIAWVHKELDMTELLNNKVKTGSKLGNEINKAVYCHPVFNLYTECITFNTTLSTNSATWEAPMCTLLFSH